MKTRPLPDTTAALFENEPFNLVAETNAERQAREAKEFERENARAQAQAAAALQSHPQLFPS